MTARHADADSATIEAALVRVRLSLDALILDGVNLGVMQASLIPGFLEKLVGSHLRELAELRQAVKSASALPDSDYSLAMCDAASQQVIDSIRQLRSFRTLPLAQVRTIAGRIATLRSDCVDALVQLEKEVGVTGRLGAERPASSVAAMSDFLSELESTLEREWRLK